MRGAWPAAVAAVGQLKGALYRIWCGVNVVESNGLIETCVALKDSVTVSILTGELTTLRERVAMLEMRLCHEPCGTDPDGPAAQHVDAVVVTTAEIHEQSTNYTVTDPGGPAAQQADAVIVTIAETQEQATNTILKLLRRLCTPAN